MRDAERLHVDLVGARRPGQQKPVQLLPVPMLHARDGLQFARTHACRHAAPGKSHSPSRPGRRLEGGDVARHDNLIGWQVTLAIDRALAATY